MGGYFSLLGGHRGSMFWQILTGEIVQLFFFFNCKTPMPGLPLLCSDLFCSVLSVRDFFSCNMPTIIILIILAYRMHAECVLVSSTDIILRTSASGSFKSELDFESMCTQTRPRFILPSERVGNQG